MAEPVTARRRQLLTALGGGWTPGLFRHLAEVAFQRDSAQLGWFGNSVPRPQGRALSSPALDSTCQPAGDESNPESAANDLEVRENGGVRLYASRIAAPYGRDVVPQMFTTLVYRYTESFFNAVRYVAEQSRYQGDWYLGAVVRPLRGVRVPIRDLITGSEPTYSAEEYREVTTVTTFNLDGDQERAVGELLNRLWRGFGLEPEWVVDKANQ